MTASLVRGRRDVGQAGAAAPRQPRPPHAAPARDRHRRVDDGREPRRPQHGAHGAVSPAPARGARRRRRARRPRASASSPRCCARSASARPASATAPPSSRLAGDADEAEDWTCDRRECFDARGRLVLPDHFGQQQRRRARPLRGAVDAPRRWRPATAAERVFLLGYADNAGRRAPAGHRCAAAMPAVQRMDAGARPAGTDCSAPPR